MERRCYDCGLPRKIRLASELPLCPHCKAERKRLADLRKEAIKNCDEYLAAKPRTVDQISKAAKAKGISYGEYVRRYGL